MTKSQELQITVRDFNGGVSDDSRKSVANEFQVTKHFDIFSSPKRLTPYRDLSADTNDGSTPTGMKQYLIRDFFYASASAQLYGLGQTGAGLTEIFQKADATTGNWSVPASSSGNGAVQNGCFFEYKDYAWGFQGLNQVFKWGLLSGTPSITNTVATVGSTITSVANGIIGKDGLGYMAYNNVLVSISTGGSITDSVLTLPTNLKITSLTRFGNYLAIGCAPINAFNGRSYVFLWNYGAPDVAEAIDWGEGYLTILENIEGTLVGVSDRYLNVSTGAGKGSMLIQTYSGGQPVVEKEVFTQALTGKSMPLAKAVRNNRVFWSAKIMTNSAGTTYNEGIWSFGRKNKNYPFALTLDIIDENVTTSGIQSFGTAGNYFFIAFNSDGSIDKTSSTATYTFTSIYESQIYDFGDPNSTKQLNSVKVFFRSLASGESVTAKYRVDDVSAWTTIGTFNTVGGLAHRFVNIESTGANFATGSEFEFRFESTGGAEIIGFALQATLTTAPL